MTDLSTSQVGGRYKWIVVGLLWLVCFFNYADRQAVFSVFPILKADLHLTDVQLGIIGSSFMWVYALAAPAAGIISDHFSRKMIVIAGFLFWSLVTIATAFSTRFHHIVIFRALEGLGEAFYFPASMSLISEYHGPATRSRALAIHQSSVYAGTIAGGSLAGFLGQYYGWRVGFNVLGGVGFVTALIFIFLIKEPPRSGPPELDENEDAHANFRLGKDTWAHIADAFRLPMSRILVMVFIGANFVAMIFLTWLPSFLHSKFKMSLSMAGVNSTAYLQIASVAGVLTGGILADRLIRKTASGRMRTQVIGLILGVPFLFLTGWTITVPLLIVAMTFFGFFKGMYDGNIWASLYDVVPANRRATACGVMNSLGWLGGGIAPVAVAFASGRWGMSACLSATALIYLSLGIFLTLGIGRYMGRGQATDALASRREIKV